MIVVDANILLYALIECDATPLTQELKLKDPDWRAPALLLHEVLNALTTQERRGVLTLAHCRGLLRSAEVFLEAAQAAVDMQRALALAAHHGITGYDAQYVALAQDLGAPLVTEDRKLRQAAPLVARSLRDFLGR